MADDARSATTQLMALMMMNTAMLQSLVAVLAVTPATGAAELALVLLQRARRETLDS